MLFTDMLIKQLDEFGSSRGFKEIITESGFNVGNIFKDKVILI